MKHEQMWGIAEISRRMKSQRLMPWSMSSTRKGAWEQLRYAWGPHLFSVIDARRERGELRAVKVTVSWEARR